MKTLLALVIAACGLAASDSNASAAEIASRNPPGEWSVATPESVGFDSAPLAEMFDFVRGRQIPIHSVQIVRHGKLVLDAYFYPFDANTRHDVASVTKSVTSALIGIAVERGHIRDVDQPLVSFFRNRSIARMDSRKQQLTLAHLLTMQAGWDCGFEPNEARLLEMRRSADWIQFMLDLPMAAEPGTRWAYCSGNCHVLSAIVTQATGTNALAFAQRELFEPLGNLDVRWPSDSRGNSHGWGDLQMHSREMAKFGQLFLQRGRWNGRQVISERWIEQATRAHVPRTSNADSYGYFWWVKGTNYPGMFEAVGRGGQRITVWPAKDLVLVFTGGGFEPGDLAPFILKALKSDRALSANADANSRLRSRIAAATRPPAPQPIANAPPLAAAISGKKFALTTNALGLSTLALDFSDPTRAQFEFVWEGHRERYPVGLDNVERFATNSIVNLPVGCKGRWLNDETFSVEVDLIGGINFYRFTLRFGEQGRTVHVALSERTGLNKETFAGETRREQ